MSEFCEVCQERESKGIALSINVPAPWWRFWNKEHELVDLLFCNDCRMSNSQELYCIDAEYMLPHFGYK